MWMRTSSLKNDDFKERINFVDGKRFWNITIRGYLQVGFFGSQERNVECSKKKVMKNQLLWAYVLQRYFTYYK